jgi:hypothetical protein
LNTKLISSASRIISTLNRDIQGNLQLGQLDGATEYLRIQADIADALVQAVADAADLKAQHNLEKVLSEVDARLDASAGPGLEKLVQRLNKEQYASFAAAAKEAGVVLPPHVG